MDEKRILDQATLAFKQGATNHIEALIADISDPYFMQDPVEVDTTRMKKFHKKELVQQAVNYRVPQPIDKKALSTKYAKLSQKKMKNILSEAKQARDEVKGGKSVKIDHAADLEREIAEMEAEIDERNVRLSQEAQRDREYDNNTTRTGSDIELRKYAQLSSSSQLGEDDEYMREPSSAEQLNIMEGLEFDEYMRLYDGEDEPESPYSRRKTSFATLSGPLTLNDKTTKGTEKSRSGKTSRDGRPQTAGAETSYNKSGTNATKTMIGQTYHDRHGNVCRGELMAPIQHKNPSIKYLKKHSKKRVESNNELYFTVLDEATLMQNKFMQCVNEANLFSKEMNKGNVYRVVERDPVEDAAWGAILGRGHSNTGLITTEARRKAKVTIPKGTGQRIAKMCVEVSHPSKDIRYLGTDHFFREHGRLQHEIQKTVAVDNKIRAPMVSAQSLDEYNNEVGVAGATNNGFSPVHSPYKSTHRQPSMRANMDRGGSSSPTKIPDETVTVPIAAALAANAALSAKEVAKNTNSMNNKETEKKEYLQYRKEVQEQLLNILGIIVSKTRKIQSQMDFIKQSGWNWLS